MLLPELEYVRPHSVEEAVERLAGHRNARVLAGGQTLLNALKLRIVHPDVLVDVSRLEALRAISRDDDGTIRVGASVTYDELVADPLVQAAHAVTAAMTSRIVDRQVRARGTIGGNVCLADPTGNYPPLLVALGARLVLRGPDGERTIPAEGFWLAPYMTAIGPGELLTHILLPPLAPGEAVGYESLQVGIDSWALARACALVRVETAGTGARTIAAARVALGCGPAPVRQPAMEAALIGLPAADTEQIAAAAALAGEQFDPPGDVHASAEYRTEMARVMARRAVLAAVKEG